MTVLAEGSEIGAPPVKRIRLSEPAAEPNLVAFQSMATPLDAADEVIPTAPLAIAQPAPATGQPAPATGQPAPATGQPCQACLNCQCKKICTSPTNEPSEDPSKTVKAIVEPLTSVAASSSSSSGITSGIASRSSTAPPSSIAAAISSRRAAKSSRRAAKSSQRSAATSDHTLASSYVAPSGIYSTLSGATSITRVISRGESSFYQTSEYQFMLHMQKQINLREEAREKEEAQTADNAGTGGNAPAVVRRVMLNGYGGLVDSHKTHSPDDCSPNTEAASPIATLSNLGNTCFLNSVLYTLRFSPSFLHNLHHLATDLAELTGKYSNLKTKSSSLGRGIGSSGKTWSNKDLCVMPQGATQEDKVAVATLRLHELYEALHASELKDTIDPYQPDVFVASLREVNTIFEGNQQHDAHELLVCILDILRETCRQLSQLNERQSHITVQPTPPVCPLPPAKSSFSSNVRKSLKLGKAKSNGLDKKTALSEGALICDQPIGQNEEEGPRVGHNFISEDFEGLMQLYTTCLECEKTNERPESFIDICVPVTTPTSACNTPEEMTALYHSAIVTEEYLQESNKYWCEYCGRYNEARRNVSFDSLPRHLILQLKRFSSSFGSSVQKVNDFMPTPLLLGCFCKKCKDLDENRKPHRGYQLYGIIMHLGSTMASGHYVAYVCSRDTVTDCVNCTRDKRKTASLSGGMGKTVSTSVVERGGLFRFFKSSKPSFPTALDGRGSFYPPCRSNDCCGIVKIDAPEPQWLECDDETVRLISMKQLEELLGPKTTKNAALTPYLLFYSRIQ